MKEIVITIGLILCLLSASGSIAYVAVRDANTKKETLPYSRPHLDFVREDDVRCVAWIIAKRGHYFVLCNREQPVFIPIHALKDIKDKRSNV